MRIHPKDVKDGQHEYTVVVADKPTWRDLWAVLRGRWEPELRLEHRVTLEGMSAILKALWTDVALGLDDPNPLLDWIEKEQ